MLGDGTRVRRGVVPRLWPALSRTGLTAAGIDIVCDGDGGKDGTQTVTFKTVDRACNVMPGACFERRIEASDA